MNHWIKATEMTPDQKEVAEDIIIKWCENKYIANYVTKYEAPYFDLGHGMKKYQEDFHEIVWLDESKDEITNYIESAELRHLPIASGGFSREVLEKIVLDAAKYGFDYRDNSQHHGEVPKGNILQWLQWYLTCLPASLHPIDAVPEIPMLKGTRDELDGL